MPTWGMGRQANRDFGEQYSASEIDADTDDENDADDADADDGEQHHRDCCCSPGRILPSLSNHLSHSNSA